MFDNNYFIGLDHADVHVGAIYDHVHLRYLHAFYFHIDELHLKFLSRSDFVLLHVNESLMLLEKCCTCIMYLEIVQLM